MPYIKKAGRERLEPLVYQVMKNMPADAGELNYLITRIIDVYVQTKSLSYAHLNEVIGVIECVKQEYYRRIATPYENDKIKQNGDVYCKLPENK